MVYEALGSSNCSWICLKCGMPNFSSCYFEPSTQLSLQNSFNVLDDSSIHAPKATSTLSKVASPPPLDKPPCPNKRGNCRSKPTASPLRILNVNCRSIVNKKSEFYYMLNDLNPDIVVGTESWHTPDIQNSEIFPSELRRCEVELKFTVHYSLFGPNSEL